MHVVPCGGFPGQVTSCLIKGHAARREVVVLVSACVHVGVMQPLGLGFTGGQAWATVTARHEDSHGGSQPAMHSYESCVWYTTSMGHTGGESGRTSSTPLSCMVVCRGLPIQADDDDAICLSRERATPARHTWQCLPRPTRGSSLLLLLLAARHATARPEQGRAAPPMMMGLLRLGPPPPPTPLPPPPPPQTTRHTHTCSRKRTTLSSAGNQQQQWTIASKAPACLRATLHQPLCPLRPGMYRTVPYPTACVKP